MFPSKIFMIYWRFHENYFFWSEFDKKKFCEKNFFFGKKNFFLYENFLVKNRFFLTENLKFELRGSLWIQKCFFCLILHCIVRIKSSQFSHVPEIDPRNRSVNQLHVFSCIFDRMLCYKVLRNRISQGFLLII